MSTNASSATRAFEIGVALDDQRPRDAISLLHGEPEEVELVDLRARRVADLDNRVSERRGRQVDHAFPALADEIEAAVAGDDVADQRRRELRHRLPARGHDVARAIQRRRH